MQNTKAKGKIPHKEALKSSDNCIQWCMQNNIEDY